ncbi:hypothetical protein [Methanoregula sp.]|jgi:hypothetical protein|uniref:hypothetical protein n=1 Tax=Methanoregula sp. TaxID=2052170 RepID=UPI003C73FF0D
MVEKYTVGICLVLAIFFFFGMGSAGVASPLASSPVTSTPVSNTTPAVSTSDVYTAPIGAFTTSDVYAEPNTTYDIDYLFYSRGYGPGTVTCNVSAYDFFGYVPDDELTASMVPSVFTVEPGHVYHSRLHVVTGQAFASPKKLNSPIYRISTYQINIDLNITLQNDTFNYGDDSVSIRGGAFIPGLPAVESDRLTIPENDTAFDLQTGESYSIPLEFSRGQGIGNVSYNISDTSLNVTVTPAEFVSRSAQSYPAQLSVHADRSLTPGNYSFTLDAAGASGIESPYSRVFFVNVTAPAEVPTQSSLPIAFVVFAVIVSGILLRDRPIY